MISEILRYRIPADQRATFESAYIAAAEHLRASSNCHGYELIESDKEPGRYLLTIWWDSAAGHLEGFRKSEQFPPFLALVKPFIPMMEEMEHYHASGLTKWLRL